MDEFRLPVASKYNWPVDSRLNYRVKHYLQLKVQYGFYEFLSTDYGRIV